MATEAAIRGYLLEEALAWLLRRSGYELLVHNELDPELAWGSNGLRVHGRGADHQADTLGELSFVPPFSLPIRLFVEAKFREAVTDIRDIRNAHGVIHDINENFSRTTPNGRPHRRYRYTYALFSTAGFSSAAQTYALAHQISLVDLSGLPFAWLRTAVFNAAKQVKALEDEVRQQHPTVKPLPLPLLRYAVRAALGTNEAQPPPSGETALWSDVEHLIIALAEQMRLELINEGQNEVLLGFPAAPFVLTMTAPRPGSVEAFLDYARGRPTHQIRLVRRPSAGQTASWEITPTDRDQAYRLYFNLPASLDDWISHSELERSRVRMVKEDLLSTILIYRISDRRTEVFRLQYSPAQVEAARR
ncbi:hypothetical protein [Dactylosporangium sp. NPDC005555]|uniref:hypothetical protein n=1 Tax=Dactylosporangium sp. NPDC005555 TaxID=3154889 RepID=UPI0033A6A31D